MVHPGTATLPGYHGGILIYPNLHIALGAGGGGTGLVLQARQYIGFGLPCPAAADLTVADIEGAHKKSKILVDLRAAIVAFELDWFGYARRALRPPIFARAMNRYPGLAPSFVRLLMSVASQIPQVFATAKAVFFLRTLVQIILGARIISDNALCVRFGGA